MSTKRSTENPVEHSTGRSGERPEPDPRDRPAATGGPRRPDPGDPAGWEADEADAAEQRREPGGTEGADDLEEREDAFGREDGAERAYPAGFGEDAPAPAPVPDEADPADAAEQHRSVPLDEDDYR